MKICKSCGALINDDARFCTRCGADNMAEIDNASQPVVNPEPSAQPQANFQPAANDDDVYYHPDNDFSNPAANAYQPPVYQQPAYAQPMYGQPAPKKKKFPVWIIIVIAVVVFGGIFAIGGLALIGASMDDPNAITEISAGYETSTEYINTSVNLWIDTTKGNFEIMTDEYKEYYESTDEDVETFIGDWDTGDYIFVAILEGSFYEASQDMDEFVEETMEYWYGDDEDIIIGDVYERVIAGKTFTCADVSQVGSSYDRWDTTTCFIREGSTFFEIEITVYPDDSSNTIDSIINTYISQYYEY